MRGSTVVFLFLLVVPAFSSITDLMQSCSPRDDTRCRFTDKDHQLFNSPEYKVRLFTLISSGVPFILWNEIGSGKAFHGVSQDCISNMEHWKRKILAGDEEALKLIDSSGKYPTASMMKTAATLGDYDLCLSMPSAQFCTLELFPKQLDKSLHGSGNFSLAQIVMFQDGGLIQTICLPAGACSAQEVKSLVGQVMGPYLMTAASGFVTCDTAASISWATTFTSLSFFQVIGLIYLLTTIWLIGCATVLHVIHLWRGMKPMGILKTITEFSAIESATKMFYVKESYFDDSRRLLLDIFKAISVCVTAISHSYAIFGAPIAFYLFDSQEKISRFLRAASSQSVSNEAGVGVFLVLSGFTAFQLMYPLAKARKLPFALAFIDRLMKFLPAMAAILAIEMLWPLLGSGPVYTHFSDFSSQRCAQFGWRNLLFVNNWLEAMDICAPQTFFAALTIQLLLAALIVTKAMAWSEKTGARLCWFLIIGCYIWTGINAWRFNVTPTLISYFPKPQDIVDQVSTVHAHFASGCSAFFIGFLTAFYVFEKKTSLDLNSGNQLIKWISINIALSSVSNGLMIANNTFGLVDRKYSPLFVVANRGSLNAAVSVFLLILYSMRDLSFVTKMFKIQQKEGNGVEGKQFSLLAAFHRLALGIFFTNMTIVHYDALTRRRLITYEIIPIISRSLFTVASVLTASFFFTILFISPSEKAVSMFFSQKVAQIKSKKI